MTNFLNKTLKKVTLELKIREQQAISGGKHSNCVTFMLSL
jgi:hypothetical protein